MDTRYHFGRRTWSNGFSGWAPSNENLMPRRDWTNQSSSWSSQLTTSTNDRSTAYNSYPVQGSYQSDQSSMPSHFSPYSTTSTNDRSNAYESHAVQGSYQYAPSSMSSHFSPYSTATTCDRSTTDGFYTTKDSCQYTPSSMSLRSSPYSTTSTYDGSTADDFYAIKGSYQSAPSPKPFQYSPVKLIESDPPKPRVNPIRAAWDLKKKQSMNYRSTNEKTAIDGGGDLPAEKFIDGPMVTDLKKVNEIYADEVDIWNDREGWIMQRDQPWGIIKCDYLAWLCSEKEAEEEKKEEKKEEETTHLRCQEICDGNQWRETNRRAETPCLDYVKSLLGREEILRLFQSDLLTATFKRIKELIGEEEEKY